MSTKPDYEAAVRLFDEGGDLDWLNDGRLVVGVLVRKIIAAALGDDPVAFAVAALIAEGGEMLDAEPRVGYELPPGRYLVFPIPAEEETTKT